MATSNTQRISAISHGIAYIIIQAKDPSYPFYLHLQRIKVFGCRDEQDIHVFASEAYIGETHDKKFTYICCSYAIRTSRLPAGSLTMTMMKKPVSG